MATLLGLYFLVFLAYAVQTERGLTADGPHYFLSILEYRRVKSPEISRWAANALTQWPVLVALRLGVEDVRLLSRLFSFGLLYLAPATLALCWLLLPAERRSLLAYPLLGVLFGWMASCFGAIAQSQVLALWFWPTAIGLAFGRLSRPLSAAAIAALALPTILLHEGMCYLGLILAAIAGWRARDEPVAAARLGWRALAAWFLAGAAIGLYFTLVPINPTDRRLFTRSILQLSFIYHDGGLNHPVIVALVGAAFLWFCQHADRSARRLFRLWFPPVALGFAALGLAPLLWPGSFQPYLQVHARSWVVLLPVPLFLAMIGGLSGRLPWAAAPKPATRWLIAAIAFAQITWQLSATAGWQSFVEIFQARIAQGSGLLPCEGWAPAAPLPIDPGWIEPAIARHWGWTNPSMSIVLAPHGRVAAIVAAPRGTRWQPFDPTRPDQLPRIRGFDFTPYLHALREQGLEFGRSDPPR